MTKAKIGTVSHGTMRSEDVIPTFIDTLAELDSECAKNIVSEYKFDSATFDFNSEDADWLSEKLFDALNEYAPEYCYFGAHPGDGSDFGFWLCEDFETMMRDDGVEIVDDLADVPSKAVAIVNDHGNISFGYIDASGFKAVWEIV